MHRKKRVATEAALFRFKLSEKFPTKPLSLQSKNGHLAIILTGNPAIKLPHRIFKSDKKFPSRCQLISGNSNFRKIQRFIP